jgi:aryl-alcohol dehydrogenase
VRINAAVLRERNAPFVIEELELDAPGPGEALVRIAGAGMCRTDLLPRHAPLVPVPVVLGHEGAGVVEAVGPGTAHVSVGDHVVISFDSCGWCARCLDGEPASCHEYFGRNLTGRRVDGSTTATDASGEALPARWFGQSSFATHAIATERNLVPVDPALPLELLAPLGCGMATGAGAVLLALKVDMGASVTVFGAGAVGLAAVMAAKVAGASEIIAVDLHAKRRELALELGATRTLDGADPDAAKRIIGWTGGADYAVDTTGMPDVVSQALLSLRPKGACGLVGVSGQDLVLTPLALGTGRVIRFIMQGDMVPRRFIPALIALWQGGRFPFDRLIRTYALDAINDAERDTNSGETVKPVLVPGR